MDKQAAFNYVCRQLMSQAKPSFHYVDGDPDKPNCLYRSENGRCAVGWMIPNKAYRKKFECKSVITIVLKNSHIRNLPYIRPWNIEELDALQKIHDKAAVIWGENQQQSWPAVIREHFEALASRINLKMEV